jgi:hypothetical protein
MNQINIFILMKKSAGLMNQTPTDCSLHIPVDNLYYILRRVALINQAPTTFKSACLINQIPTIGSDRSTPLQTIEIAGLVNQAPPFLHLGSDWSFDDPRNNRNLCSP